MEQHETALEAVIREIREETGFDFSKHPIETLETVYVEYSREEHFVYRMFRTKFDGDPGAVKINFHEHKGFTWVKPEDALRMELLQMDMRILDRSNRLFLPWRLSLPPMNWCFVGPRHEKEEELTEGP